MDLTHRFTVPADIETTWATFQDIQDVAGCFPGAVVTEVDGDDFKGTCKVKLGPIAMVYSGTGTFLEKDEAAKRFVVEAKGKDKRGNGTAGAKVTASLTAAGDSTDVEVVTDLAITGKPAQFGRGVIQDVSDKLLGQFVDCLEQKVGAGNAPAEPEPSPAAGAAAPATEAAPSTAGTAPEVGEGSDAMLRSVSGPGSGPTSQTGAATPTAPAASATGGRSDEGEALDLGATVIPILAKAYWKQALGALLVLAVLIRILRRR